MGNKDNTSTEEEIKKIIKDTWESLASPVVIWTNIEGVLNFQQFVVESYGGIYTEEDRERDKQKLLESKQTIFKL